MQPRNLLRLPRRTFCSRGCRLCLCLCPPLRILGLLGCTMAHQRPRLPPRARKIPVARALQVRPRVQNRYVLWVLRTRLLFNRLRLLPVHPCLKFPGQCPSSASPPEFPQENHTWVLPVTRGYVPPCS